MKTWYIIWYIGANETGNGNGRWWNCGITCSDAYFRYVVEMMWDMYICYKWIT